IALSENPCFSTRAGCFVLGFVLTIPGINSSRLESAIIQTAQARELIDDNTGSDEQDVAKKLRDLIDKCDRLLRKCEELQREIDVTLMSITKDLELLRKEAARQDKEFE